MNSFLNIIAAGARSLSFEKRCSALDYEYKAYEPKIAFRKISLIKPRTPAEIMRSAWEDVGSRMWEAIRDVEKEYGQ